MLTLWKTRLTKVVTVNIEEKKYLTNVETAHDKVLNSEKLTAVVFKSKPEMGGSAFRYISLPYLTVLSRTLDDNNRDTRWIHSSNRYRFK